MRKIVGVLLVASLFGGCEKAAPVTAGDGKAADEQNVALAARKGRIVDEVSLNGVVRSAERIEIRADRRVRIAKAVVNVADSVTRGQKLIEVDKSELIGKLKELTGRKKSAELEISSLDVQLEHKKKLLARKKILLEKDIIPVREIEEAAKDVKIEENNQAAKRLEFEKIVQDLAEARLATDVADTVSPMDGVVVDLKTAAGDANSGDVLATVVNPDRMALFASIDEQNRMRLQVGAVVKVSLDAAEGKTYDGVVRDVAMTPEAGRPGGLKTFAVRIDFAAPDVKLAEGFKGRAQLVFKTADDAVIVPRSALRVAAGKVFVVLASKLGGIGDAREVQVGIESETEAEITAGLEAGQAIMVSY